MNISPARTAAFDILLRIETERAYSSVLLPIFEADMSPIDRGLCHELTLGTLRRQLYLDKLIEKLTAGRKLDIEIRIALRLGLYQLNYLDKIPQYSAINESVNLVRRAKKTSAKAFVNAILRRASREGVELSFLDEIEKTSIETSHPRWLLEKWIDEFGIETATQMVRSNNEIPKTAIRVIGELSDEGHRLVQSARASSFVEGCFLLDGQDHRVFELSRRGEIYLQDEASQMTAQVVVVPADGSFLDVCAAPGGKTGMIAGRHSRTARLMVAGDLHQKRVEYLIDNCRHQGAEVVEIVRYDAEKGLPFEEKTFDVVLVDAPCSGTGTIRHNPELRYFLKPGDFTDLSLKQLSILKNASELVRPGGTMIYSTCSVEKEENEDVVSKLLFEHPEFRVITPNVAEIFMTESGFARTFPHRDNMDGFFIAALRRN